MTESTFDVAGLGRTLHAPIADLTRSPAARRVARLAADAGLFLFDYERRVQLELPEDWLPVGRPDLGVTGLPPDWERGLLGESKYLSFRHDLLLGSLHAGHRAKWSTHELCHGLVGFCWKADGSMLFHALAARLAEALPVALWYFFDEAGLQRCERHALQTEVGPSFCRACERAAVASTGSASSVSDDAWTARGLTFLAREVDGVRRSITEGRPMFTPHGAIDLMTDGLAYASAHAPRLRAPEMQAQLAAMFAGTPGPELGLFDELEAFAAHIEKLGAYVAGHGPAPRVVSGGRWRFVAQDLAGRVMQIAADSEGECFAGLEAILQGLVAGTEAAVANAIASYVELHESFELPEPDDVFALGYALPGHVGVGVAQLRAGLESAMGATLTRLGASLGEGADGLVARFASALVPSREPIGTRFAAFLKDASDVASDSETLGLAALEAAIASASPPDPIELGLGLDGALAETLSLPIGVELVRAGFDAGGLLMHGVADPKGPRSFLVRRDAGDEVGLVALSEPLAQRLSEGPLDAAAVVVQAEHDSELRALLEEGLLIPDRWDLAIA